VEWGHGLVEGLAGDRLEVTLERSATAPAGTGAEDTDDVDELRVVSVSATGDRWAGIDLASLVPAT
jgi:tRNA threonylcarbamoyladenosine biosynthesis protein TsaE